MGSEDRALGGQQSGGGEETEVLADIEGYVGKRRTREVRSLRGLERAVLEEHLLGSKYFKANSSLEKCHIKMNPLINECWNGFPK